jgi:hypothetical protein
VAYARSYSQRRLFGLTNGEGNHGEAVKEHYHCLEATPTHSYLKMLYTYPQSAFPYARLVAKNRGRRMGQPEYELRGMGAFDDERYFEVFVEYAQAEPDDILTQVTMFNPRPDAAPLHVLPQRWLRNTWSWKLRRRPARNAPGSWRAACTCCASPTLTRELRVFLEWNWAMVSPAGHFLSGLPSHSTARAGNLRPRPIPL